MKASTAEIAPASASASLRSWLGAAIAFVAVVAFYACTIAPARTDWGNIEARGAYYNLLVDGFRAGQLSLAATPPAGLLALADPYDPAANAVYRNQHHLHDTSLYRGRLYLYYGITPALVLFGPYRLLTGGYLLNKEAAVIFAVGAFAFSALLLADAWRRYFSDAPAAVLMLAVLVLGTSNSVPALLSTPAICELCIACGQCFALLACLAIWRALHARPSRAGGWVALASASYGLAVGARPSLLFGALILLAPWFHARKCDHGAPPSPRRRRLLVAALGPIALIGAGLALYNHARFGDIFEFGQRYQLAGDRQDAARHFGIDYVGFNFRLYFLSAAPWSAVFPFVRPVALPPAPFGHASAESALGILTNTPFALLAPLGAWLIGRDRRAATRPLRIGLAALAWWFAASAGVLLLFYGTVLRYQAEFHPALALLAAFGVLALEQRLAAATRLVRIGARTAWIGAALFSVAVSLLMNVVLRADEYNRQAVQAEAAGDLALAQTKLEAALRLQADHVAANGNFGQLLLARGDLAGATVRFHTALAREPGNLAARDGLGRALAAQNKPREAAEQFQAIIAAEPRNAFAQVSLATMLLQLGRAPEAVTHYETAIRLGLDSPAIRAALAQAREAAGAR